MRKKMTFLSAIFTVFTILIAEGILYFKGGISELEWMDYFIIIYMIFLSSMFVKGLLNMIYYQKRIIENYRGIFKKFKELHKLRYRMYFESIDNEKIEQCTQVLNEYIVQLLRLGTEIRDDDDYPESYRTEANEIIINTLKLAKQIQS